MPSIIKKIAFNIILLLLIFGFHDNIARTLGIFILDKYKASKEAYEGDDPDSEYLKLFMFMSLLSYDVFIKKMLIEQIVDELRNLEGDSESSNKKEKSGKKK